MADDALQSGAQRVKQTLLSSQRNMSLLLAQSAVQVRIPTLAGLHRRWFLVQSARGA